MKKVLFIIVGLPGSGKSFAASVIKKRFRAKVFENGDIIREEIKRRSLPYTPENDKKIRLWFHAGREHLIMERIWKKMKNVKGIVVLVGLRNLKELSMIKKSYKGKLVLIKIESSFKVRVNREIKRGRFGKQDSAKYLKQRDKSELSDLVGLKYLLKKADYTIINSNISKKQMEKRVVNFIKAII